MPLLFLLGPSVPNPVGTVTEIVNAKQSGAQGMHWSFDSAGGFYQANRRYTNTLRVFTSSSFVGPIQVQQAVLGIGAVQGAYYKFPLPEYHSDQPAIPSDPTEIDTGSFCSAIEFAQDAEDARQWLVTLSYSSLDVIHEMGQSQLQNGSVNPLEAAPQVHWSAAKYSVSYELDINGKPWRNTAGDPWENNPQTEESRPVLSFIRNEETYNDVWAQAYRDSVNSDLFLGWLPNQVKCKDISGKRVYAADWGYYWEVSYEFEFRIGTTTVVNETDDFGITIGQSTNQTGWDEKVLNTGFRQLVGGTGNPQQITINGSLITSPVILQLNGSYDPNPALEPVYLTFKLYPSVPFAPLNIPDELLTQNQ